MTKEEDFDTLKPITESSHLSKFLNPNFNSDSYLISKFEKLKENKKENKIEEEIFEEELISLKTGIEIIENKIEKIVINSREKFLSQVKNIPTLERKVEDISKSLNELESSMEK